MTKIYKCECGKEFSNPQQSNGHKNHCIIHLEAVGKSDSLQQHYNSISVSVRKYQEKCKQVRLQQEQLKLTEWISEKHRCKKCGKIMIVKYGTGAYCSPGCAHSHKHTEEWKQEMSLKIHNLFDSSLPESVAKKAGKKRSISNEERYYVNPSLCKVCGKVIPYTIRHRKTCSEECFQKQNGGFREGSVKRHKHGTYKGIRCDSSWELAFVVYNIEHDITLIRNTSYFTYLYQNKKHKYYPDFIVGDTFIEIKNYWTEQVQAKIDQFPKDKKYRILYWEDIKPYIDYCINKYGKSYWEVLYDKGSTPLGTAIRRKLK